MTLRNPDSRTQRFTLDLRQHLELPGAVTGRFEVRRMRCAGARDIPSVLDTELQQTVHLAPFEVVTLELTPVIEAK